MLAVTVSVEVVEVMVILLVMAAQEDQEEVMEDSVEQVVAEEVEV